VVDSFAGSSSIGALTLLAGRSVTFAPGGASFGGDVTIGDVSTTQPLNIVFAGNVTAAGHTLTVHAVNDITQTTSSGITAGQLTGSSGSDATFLGPNHVALGAFTIGDGRTFTFNSADPLDLTVPLSFPTGNLVLSSTGSITLDASLTVGGTLSLEANGALTQRSGTIEADSFSGSSVGGATLDGDNRIKSLTGFTNVGIGDVVISDTVAATIRGGFASPGSVIITAKSIVLADSSFAVGNATVLSTPGDFIQTGTATFSGRLVALDSTGASTAALAAFDTVDIATALNGLVSGGGHGALTLGTINAPSSTLLLSAGTSAISVIALTADRLAVDGAGASAAISGIVGGATGTGAAQLAFKNGQKDNNYKINDCAIGATACIVVPRFVPIVPPSTLNIVLLAPTRAPDDSNLQAFSVGNEDLIQ
jgi:hypothetical protein